MAEVTYYFNAYVTPVWADPDNLVDGDIGTFASTGTKKIEQTLTGNTCPAEDLGIITKVEIRVYAYGDGNDRIDITPIFTGGDGDVHETTPVVSPGAWTAYVDITSDTNHPDWSLWSHIQDLDCIINNVAVAKANPMYCSKVEIRVTYTPYVAPTVTTQAVTSKGSTSARGNGNITATGGQNCSKRGICWNTTGNPTVADSKSEETDSFGTGAFNRWMTGLTPGEHYYVKAYAYNSEGYGYGGQVEFDTWTPPVSDIDVGADPIDRIASLPLSTFTYIDKNNPANASGTLHSIKVYAYSNITGLRVGTFYTTNGDTLKCRDSVLIGDVEAGAERIFTGLSITVEAGDYIGCYFGDGTLFADSTGFDGIWNVSGEYIDPNDETNYGVFAGFAISLYGYGDIVAAPENTVYLVKATGKRTQLSVGAVAIRIDPATGRRSTDTTLTKFLVREDDGTLRAKSA